ncbi:GNAT family N-acetyltransferase [Flavobacterium sp.]|jgi:ElaA protein|uniref:GNAT family N-acetyltransferase n=1 Tax=Flavobacterium sp. TaxID=239 RepID=UPI002629CED4|nr:GNAT family N-acetyltransferase [Flavobacterium sp.]
METKFKIKRFNELSLDELYQCMKLRSLVFVVEQNCVYLDIDSKDDQALHVLGYQNDCLMAYARLFDKGAYFDETSIGRVVVHPDFRRINAGHALMEAAIQAVYNTFGIQPITISAQLYLQKFYESHGFEVISPTYLEDDIPHIRMRKN